MRSNRALDPLKPLLDRRVTVYALAAAAYFGGGPLTAKGEVVYTSAKQFGEGELGARAMIPIDLNHDGIVDFTLAGVAQIDFSTNGYVHTDIVYVNANLGNSVAVFGTRQSMPLADALPFEQRVGPGLDFQPPGIPGFSLALLFSAPGGGGYHAGNFFDQKNKFLGLKLQLDGKTYYGWARVNVKEVNNNFVFELVDYAYQDTPNVPIRAGEGIPKPSADSLTFGTDSIPQASLSFPAVKCIPATLGMLAYGSDALPAWRR